MSSDSQPSSYASLLTKSTPNFPKESQSTDLPSNPDSPSCPQGASAGARLMGSVCPTLATYPTPESDAHFVAPHVPSPGLATIKMTAPKLDDAQVKLLEHTCLFGKARGEFVPHAAVVSRLKRDWKFCGGR